MNRLKTFLSLLFGQSLVSFLTFFFSEERQKVFVSNVCLICKIQFPLRIFEYRDLASA